MVQRAYFPVPEISRYDDTTSFHVLTLPVALAVHSDPIYVAPARHMQQFGSFRQFAQEIWEAIPRENPVIKVRNECPSPYPLIVMLARLQSSPLKCSG